MELRKYIKLGNNTKIVFENYFRDNFQKFCAFSNKYLNDLNKSEDIVQESLLIIWEDNKRIYDSEIALHAYVYKIIRSKCINFIKKQKKELQDNENYISDIHSDEFFEKTVVIEETEHIIYKAIEQLTTQHQKIISMHLNGLKNAEIAEELDISVNTVKSHKNTAFNHLKKILNPHLSTLLFYLR